MKLKLVFVFEESDVWMRIARDMMFRKLERLNGCFMIGINMFVEMIRSDKIVLYKVCGGRSVGSKAPTYLVVPQRSIYGCCRLFGVSLFYSD